MNQIFKYLIQLNYICDTDGVANTDFIARRVLQFKL